MPEREISRLIRRTQVRINALHVVSNEIKSDIKRKKRTLKLMKKEIKQRKKELRRLMKMGL